nr:T9SS type A sorting domain-containing protein [Spirosoma montaniterrae]
MGAVEFQDAPAAFTVTVSASPGLTITSGQTVTLTATGGTSYTWTDGTTGSSFTATPGVGSTTYSVTGVNAAGCTSTTSVTVTVNPAPTLAGFAPTAATVCVGSVATFTATVGDVTGAYNFTLTNGTGPVSGTATGASFSQTLTASGSGQQTFTLTIGANGTTVASSTTLSVQALPTAGINLPTNLTLTCASPTVSISATGGGTYRWDDNSTTASRSLTASGTYSVTVTSAGGCSSTASQLVTLTLNNTAPSLALSSTNVCAGNVVNLSATAGLTSYTFVGGSGVISTGTSNTVAVSELSTASYSFTVLAAGPNGCTATATTSLTVLPRPAAPALSSQSRSLTASPTPVSLTGFVEATGNALSFSGVTGLLDPPTANISTAGVQNFSVSQTNANGCISPVTLFSLTVTAPVVVTPASQTVCRGSQVVLTAGTTGTRYEWYRGGQLPANRLINVVGVQVGTGTASLTLVSVQTTATYFCKIFAANGSFTWAGPFAVVVNAGCVAPGGRVAAQLETPLRVIIAPNPVEGGWLRAVVTGAGGQRLRAQLTDLNGQVLREQQWEQADTKHLIEWDMQARPGGVYLLQIGTDGQHTTLKLIKP